MSRPLRIEYENAWYHVIDRGARKMNIFNNDDDRRMFLRLLAHIHDKYRTEIHAYCLMDNHYHLLLRTPLPNLSRSLQCLNGMYAQNYNKTRSIDGPLFRGRFKSIIVDADNYLLRLSRYIHLNPVKGKLVSKAEDYKWSSCAAYLGQASKEEWLQTEDILSHFGDELQSQKYHLFLEGADDDDDELDAFFSKIKILPVLGAKDFVKTIKKKYLPDRVLSPEIPEQKKLYRTKSKLPMLQTVMNVVAQYYEISIDELKYTAKGKVNEPRAVAIYLAMQMTGKRLCDVAGVFTITYSAVSRIANKIADKMEKNINFEAEINEIKKICLSFDDNEKEHVKM